MIMQLRPACLALALAVTAGPACAQTWVYEPDVGARVVYAPRVYTQRYIAPVYNAYAYQPVVTAPAAAIGPSRRTVVSRTIIPRRGRAPIVKERIVTDTYAPAATAAPDPPLDPPGLCSMLHGFRTGPKCGFADVIPYAS